MARLPAAEKWWIGQSMDNQILVYSARDRFRQHPRKVFKGHLVAGFACQPNFSPDGRYAAAPRPRASACLTRPSAVVL